MNFYHSVSSNKAITLDKPLDIFTNVVAGWSVRKVRSAYTGYCMEVYNGTSYSDIGFDSNGDLDVSAIETHCGSNDGYVSKLYDQSGNGHHAAQTDTSLMPKMYDGASQSVFFENGKPQIQGDSYQVNAKQEFLSISTEINGYPNAHNFVVMQRSSQHVHDTPSVFSHNRFAGAGAKYISQLSNSGGAGIGTNLHIDGSASSIANQKNSFGNALGTKARIVNSVQNYNVVGYTAISRIGAGRNIHHLQEFIIFDSDMSDFREIIEKNQNSYFSVF